MTQTHNLIVQYAGIMFDRNLLSFGNEITKNDIINEVISKNCKTEQDAIKTTRDVVFYEKRRLLSKIQQRQQRELTGEKYCNGCRDNKPVADFYTRVDSRTGYRYLCYLCKECERKRHNDYYHKKRYENNSDQQKQRRNHEQRAGVDSARKYAEIARKR